MDDIVEITEETTFVEIPYVETIVEITGDQVSLVEVPSQETVLVVQEPGIDVITIPTQGPPGPKGDSGSGTFSAENKEGVTIRKGQAVAVHASGNGMVLADAVANGKSAVGLVATDTTNAAAGNVQIGGPFEMSDWTNVIGSASLAARAMYFLGQSGQLTTQPSGVISQFIGQALSSTVLGVEIEPPILL